jgi:hypothetical protein
MDNNYGKLSGGRKWINTMHCSMMKLKIFGVYKGSPAQGISGLRIPQE